MSLLKNSWFLAGLLILLSLVGIISMFTIMLLIGGGNPVLSVVGAVLAAMVLSQIYVYKFGESMPKLLALKVVIIYVSLQFFGILILLSATGLFSKSLATITLAGALVLVLNVFYGLALYLILVYLGREYLKILRKKSR